MSKYFALISSLTLLILFGGSSVLFGDQMQDGFDAYKREDFKESFKYFHRSAVQGDALAQLLLGLMYDEGKGVLQDHAEAVKWYSLSAELGNASAQSNLGLMYAEGQGVTQDFVLAYMWFNLASSNGSTNGLEGLKMVKNKMSLSQIEKAKEMARNWKPNEK